MRCELAPPLEASARPACIYTIGGYWFELRCAGISRLQGYPGQTRMSPAGHGNTSQPSFRLLSLKKGKPKKQSVRHTTKRGNHSPTVIGKTPLAMSSGFQWRRAAPSGHSGTKKKNARSIPAGNGPVIVKRYHTLQVHLLGFCYERGEAA